MENPGTVPDGLMLYALSRAYNRHTLVFCKNRIWTTIEITEPMDEMALMNACNLHLVYVSEGVNGELKIKPFKGGVPDPITMEKLEMALSQICMHGRPRTKMLNLVVKKHSSTVHWQDSSTADQHDDTEYDPVEFPMFGPIAFPEKEQVVHLNTDNFNAEEISALNTALEDHQANSGVISNTEDAWMDTGDRMTTEATITSKTKMKINQTTLQSHPIVESPKPITWLVGTGLVCVTYDQLQGEIMAIEDYLQMDKPKKKSNPTNNMKGGNNLSFLDDTPASHNSYEENMKGQNKNVPNVNMQQKVEDLFASTARTNICYIPLERLHDDGIQSFKPSMKLPSIDPFSRLEDVGDTDTKKIADEVVSEKDKKNWISHERIKIKKNSA